MKGLFIFLLTTLVSSLAMAQETGRRVDYRNPKAGDYIPFDHFLTFGCRLNVMPDQAEQFDLILDSIRLLGDWEFRLEVHTDCRASAEYNDTLSQIRVDTIRAYFISKGFPAWRLTAKGMGERMLYLPKCSCELTDAGNRVCDEKEHQLNRRTLIRLVEKIEWTGQEPFSMLFPSPGQFRLFPVTRFKGTTDIWDVRIQTYTLVRSLSDAYITIHHFPGSWGWDMLSFKKRKEAYYNPEEHRLFSGAPSRINVVHHRYGDRWGALREGFVVVIDSVVNKANILSAFGLKFTGEALIYDVVYDNEFPPPWEPIFIGGIAFFEIPLSWQKTYELWIITTDYPGKGYAFDDGKVWEFVQPSDTSELIGYDALNRLATVWPELSLIKEIKYKHVPGVALPCMYILMPRDE